MKFINKKITGSVLLLCSAALYGLVGVFSRYIREFAPFSQSWVKSSFLLLIVFLFFISKKVTWKKIRREDLKWFALWILPASFQPVLTFLAFNHLAIGTTYFLTYSTMILGGILSGKIFFSEKLNLNKILSLLLLFIGLFLIYKSDITFARNIYVFFALLAGLLLGFWNTLTKKVSGNYPEFQMIVLDNATALLLCFGVSMFIGEKLPVLEDVVPWIWIVLFAASLTAAAFLLIRGFKFVEAQVGTLILPMEVVFGSFFGFLFFGEVLKINVYLGGFIILMAAILSALGLSKSNDLPQQII